MAAICKVKLTQERITKGAILYTTQSTGVPVTSIYLRKEHMPTVNWPHEITITVEADEV